MGLYVSALFSDRSTACFCSELPFKEYLYSEQPWKTEIVEIVSHSGEKERHA